MEEIPGKKVEQRPAGTAHHYARGTGKFKSLKGWV